SYGETAGHGRGIRLSRRSCESDGSQDQARPGRSAQARLDRRGEPMNRRRLAIGFVVLGSLLLAGCGKFIGNLRRDLDDSEPYSQPTYGGRWTEKGFLSDNLPEGPDRYAQVGHSERNPASDAARNDNSSWISPE